MSLPAPRLTEAFLDSAYAIALSAPTDDLHLQAMGLAERIERDGTKMVTTVAVLLEIGNALSKHRYRSAATALLQSLRSDSNIEVVTRSDELYA